MLAVTDVEAVQTVVSSLTLADAFDILAQINPIHLDQIHYVETADGAQEFVFEELGEDARNQCAKLPTFWRTWYEAGPPNNREWVYGSICQFVADAILTEIVAQGEKPVADVVRKVLSVGAP
jgi:hypothetical protein